MSVERTRLTVALIGLCMAALAVTAAMATISRELDPLAWLWPSAMTAAAVSCFVFAVKIASAAWWWLSRTTTVLGVLARSGLVWMELVRRNYPDGWLGAGSFVVTLLAAYALHRLWFVDFRYWSRVAARDAVS